MANTAREWIVDRFALRPIYDNFLNRRVPRAPWYVGDGTTLLTLVGVQMLTGILLALNYSPAADYTYQSIVYITEQQVLGWFIRGLHYWSAGMIMIMVFYHLFRQILMAGYKSPREGTWLIGVCLFFCVLVMSYTGYLLRWDERAIYGVRVMLHTLSRVPLIGEWLVLMVQGGEDIGPRTLSRLYAVHVILVPALLAGLIGCHLYLIVLRGTITHAERGQPVHSADEQRKLYKEEAHSADKGETFMPQTMFKTGTMAGAILAVAVTLTVVVGPAQLYSEATLIENAMPTEEWWYWWLSGLIALMPPAVAPWFLVLFPIAVFTFLFSLPFIDRSPKRGIKARPFWALFVVLMAVSLLLLSDYRRRSGFTGWPDPEPPRVPAEVALTAEAEQGRILFAQYGCNSCHAVAGHGRRVGHDFAEVRNPRSHEEILQFVLRPPAGVAMPAYEGRLSGDELKYVVEFCHVAQTFPRRF